MKRGLVWAVTILLAGFAIFVGYGSWQTFTNTERILAVGSATAQNSGWPTPDRAADIGYVGDPMAAYGYAFKDIAIETELGAAPAWLVRPEQGAGSTWAIIVHGIGGRRENGYRFLPTFQAAGMPTMLISYRNDEGAPRAPDGHYAFGLTEWHDLDDAARYAINHGADSLVLLGESMGGGIVGQFLRHSDLARHVGAVVLDAAAIDFGGVLVPTMREQEVPMPGLLAWGGMQIAAYRLPFDLRKANVTEEFARFRGPMFIAHGAGDHVVPVALSDRLAARRTAPTEYLRTQAEHIQSWKEDPARFDAALLAFLETLP